MSEEEIKALDKELSHAPTMLSFLIAVFAKYGITGMVVLFLGWQWIEKDSQMQKNNEALVQLVRENTTAIIADVEVNRRVLDYLERKEREASRMQ